MDCQNLRYYDEHEHAYKCPSCHMFHIGRNGKEITEKT